MTTKAQAILADLMQDLKQPTKQETVIGGLLKQLDGAPYGVTSFNLQTPEKLRGIPLNFLTTRKAISISSEQLDAAAEARRTAQGMDVLTAQLKSIVDGILMSPDIADKAAAIEAAAAEFGRRIRNPEQALKEARTATELKSAIRHLLPFKVEEKPGGGLVQFILQGFEELR